MIKAPRLSHDQRVFTYALLSGLPAIMVALCLLWTSDQAPRLQWTLTLLIVGCWLGFAAAVRQRVVYPLQTMANLLSALREGDFSIRARGARRDEALGDAMAEINALSGVLQQQRFGVLEATALLRTVIEEIDVAIFAFDSQNSLRLVNRAGQQLLAQPPEHLFGRSAADLGLGECLDGEPSRVLTSTTVFPGATGRWGMRRTPFRQDGRPHQLVVIADLSHALRKEELEAWQRLVRVLGHELNNSLAPIKSIAGSLSASLQRTSREPEWENDLRTGLDIIATRAESLARFMQAYAQLARLPAPTPSSCALPDLIERVVGLERRLPVQIVGGPALTLTCDGAQIEQVLINLLKNSVDAVLEWEPRRADAGVRVRWKIIRDTLEIAIEDDGPGVAHTTNLFVPFFTTKRDGSGIGLVLCRQIAENHGGSLTLANRSSGLGCIATLRLPFHSISPQKGAEGAKKIPAILSEADRANC